MIFRIILMFLVLTGASSALLYLAACTNYFNAGRLKLIARNVALAGAGVTIALITIGLLVSINA